MKKKLLLALILTLVMVFATACSGNGDGDTDGDGDGDTAVVHEWKLQNGYPPGDQCWDIQMPMIVDAIETASEGQIKITTYIPGAICDPEQAPVSVANGLLECAISAPGECGQLIPAAWAEQGIPFYWETAEDQAQNFYDYGLLEWCREIYAPSGLYYGMPVPNGAYSMMTSFPVESAADLSGKKIRANSSYGQFVQQLGGAPVLMAGGDIYQGLKLGTIEGCIYSFAEIYSSKLGEVVKYVMEQPGSGSAPVNFIIGQKAWDALSPELQDAVNKAMEDVIEPIIAANTAFDAEARTFAEESGVQFITITDENMVGFWDAGSATAEQIATEYPDAAPGLEIIKAWHSAVK